MRVGDQAKPPLGGEDFEGPQDVVRIVEGLAHPHEYEVCEAGRARGRDDLVEDLGCGERLLESLAACCAEAASHAASGLRGDAERGARRRGIGRLDEMALQGSEEVFLVPSVDTLSCSGARVRGETLGKVLSVQGSDIGHAQGVSMWRT